MRHVFVTSQHHHSSWHVHLLDCVTDSIQTDHHDQLDVPFQVFEVEQLRTNVYSLCLMIKYFIPFSVKGRIRYGVSGSRTHVGSDIYMYVLSEEGFSSLWMKGASMQSAMVGPQPI